MSEMFEGDERNEVRETVKDILESEFKEQTEEFLDGERLEILPRGRHKTKIGYKQERFHVNVEINQTVISKIDEFCDDNSLSRSAFIRLAVYKLAKELGIHDYVSRYDQELERQRRVAEAPVPNIKPGNPYKSPWTTDHGDLIQ